MYESLESNQAAEIEMFNSEEEHLIPSDIDYGAIGGLSDEVRSILIRDRPRSLGAAKRIEGVTPMTLLVLMHAIAKKTSSPTRQPRSPPASSTTFPLLRLSTSSPSPTTASPPSTASQRGLHSAPAKSAEWTLDPHASALDIPLDSSEPRAEVAPVVESMRRRPPRHPRAPQPSRSSRPQSGPLPSSPEEVRALLLGVLQKTDDTRLERVLKQLQIGDDSVLISKAFIKFAIAELEDETSSTWEDTWDVASLQLDFEAVSADARGGSWQKAVDICILHRLLEWSPSELDRRRCGLFNDSSLASSGGQPSLPALTKLARLAAATDFRSTLR